jgi:hypothetical protein
MASMLPVRWCAAILLAVTLLPATAEGQRSSPTRAFVSVNVGSQASSTEFDHVTPVPVSREDGTLTTAYGVDSGFVFDVGGAMFVRPRLWLGASVSHFSTSGDAEAFAQVPHPFFFNQHRAVQGTPSGISRAETSVHVSLLWDLVAVGRWQLKVLGGPTFFSARQDLVTAVQYDESFPFDTAAYTAADVEESSASGVGFHAGADFSTYLTPSIGIGALLRYSRGEVTFGDAPVPVSATTGGVNVAGGVRVRF